MQPVPAAVTWSIPPIETEGDLARWFSVWPGELRWFADLKGLTFGTERARLSHYHYRLLTKSSGAIRLIESPKPRLKEMQRQILASILEKVPAHSAVHGFFKGRSVKTFTAPHVGRRVVLRMDVQDF